jgi:hypothetical protein
MHIRFILHIPCSIHMQSIVQLHSAGTRAEVAENGDVFAVLSHVAMGYVCMFVCACVRACVRACVFVCMYNRT